MSDDWLFIPSGKTPEKLTTKESQEQTPSSTASSTSKWLFTPSGETPEVVKVLSPSSTIPPVSMPRKKSGRVALHNRYPEIVSAAKSYIEQSGFEAAHSRNSEIGLSVGARLCDVQSNFSKRPLTI